MNHLTALPLPLSCARSVHLFEHRPYMESVLEDEGDTGKSKQLLAAYFPSYPVYLGVFPREDLSQASKAEVTSSTVPQPGNFFFFLQTSGLSTCQVWVRIPALPIPQAAKRRGVL